MLHMIIWTLLLTGSAGMLLLATAGLKPIDQAADDDRERFRQ